MHNQCLNLLKQKESKKHFEEMLGWFKYEIRQYTESDISLEDLNQHKDIITLLNGTDSKGSFPQEVNFYIDDAKMKRELIL